MPLRKRHRAADLPPCAHHDQGPAQAALGPGPVPASECGVTGTGPVGCNNTRTVASSPPIDTRVSSTAMYPSSPRVAFIRTKWSLHRCRPRRVCATSSATERIPSTVSAGVPEAAPDWKLCVVTSYPLNRLRSPTMSTSVTWPTTQARVNSQQTAVTNRHSGHLLRLPPHHDHARRSKAARTGSAACTVPSGVIQNGTA